MSPRAALRQEEPVLPLPEDYLTYPHRSYGMDQDRYEWSPADRRTPLRLKNGAKSMATIVVPLEFFPLNPLAEPFKHPGAMKTPYPDLRHFTTRDYGNRVGVFRLLRALDKSGLMATFAVNVEIARRYPPLLEAIRSAGHEVAAHGVSTAHIHHAGLSEGEERQYVDAARAAFPDAKTWMSPARNQSFATLDLIREAGFEICLDWESDQRPLNMQTSSGPITALPLMNELGDFKLLIDRSQSEDEWADQIIEAARFHIEEYEARGAQCFAFTLTPYVAGQPFRINAVRRILNSLADMNGLTVATATETASAFKDILQ